MTSAFRTGFVLRKRIKELTALLADHAEETMDSDDVDQVRAEIIDLYDAAEREAERLLYIAEHLFQMVPQSAWRDSGGDDMQGHYEGDYHAEKLREELAELRAALADRRQA